MAQKSKIYYHTRSAVRGVVRLLALFAAYVIVHLAASSIWTALLFISVVACGFIIHDHKTHRTASTI